MLYIIYKIYVIYKYILYIHTHICQEQNLLPIAWTYQINKQTFQTRGVKYPEIKGKILLLLLLLGSSHPLTPSQPPE